ncbi:MAG: bactofilin family protein, partial [Bdellovibrionota bacterium]
HPSVLETSVNILGEGTRIEGKVLFDHISRVHGTLKGEIRAKEGSTLILSDSSVVEGNIDADTLMVDGYVQGDITARTRVVISRTGRVVGNIKTPLLTVEFGAYFEGRCLMDGTGGAPQAGRTATSAPLASPA